MASAGNNSGDIYPNVIEIQGESLKYFKNHSELIATLLENQGNEESLELSSDVLFGGDTNKWKLFLDLFFPEEGYGKLFEYRGGEVIVKESRGGEEALMDVLRYMLVNEAGTEIEFAKEQARKQINAPAQIAPRGVGIRAPRRPILQLRNNYFLEFGNNRENWGNNNWGNNNEENTKLGYTEEEEGLLGKLKGKNAKKYYPNQGGRRRSNRRTRRSKSRRTKKKTRRGNRK
jgi:hypothetical protein